MKKMDFVFGAALRPQCGTRLFFGPANFLGVTSNMKGKADFVNSGFTPEEDGVLPTHFNTISEDVDRKEKRNGWDIVRKTFVSDVLKRESVSRVSRQESVDFETAINRAGYGKYNYFLLLVAFPVTVSSGMVSGCVSLVLPAISCDFQITNFEKGVLQVAPYIGMIIAGFFWGSASDTLGRKTLLTYGFILDGLSGIGASLSPNLWLMVIFKFLTGALNCGPSSIYMAYLSETFIKKHRDAAVFSCGVFSAFGNVFQPCLALLLMYHFPIEINVIGGYVFSSWRLYLFACALPSLFSGICCAFFLESPKFLLEKGRKEEALKVFKSMYKLNTGRPDASYPVQTLHDIRSPSIIATAKLEPNKTFGERVRDGMRLSMRLFQKPYIGRAIYYFIIQFGAMASLNSFRLWLPQIFTIAATASANTTEGVGLCELLQSSSNSPVAQCAVTSPISYTNMIIINAGLFVSHPVCLICAHYFGKKVPIIITTLVPSFFLLAIPFIPASYVVYVSTVGLSLLQVSFFALLASVVDTFPTSMKATSVAMTQLSGRVGVLLTMFLVAMFVFTHCTIIILGLGTLLFAVGIVALVLPTKPLNLSRRKPAPTPQPK